MRDFNIDLSKHNNHAGTMLFLEIMYSYGVFPLITKPTRITSDSATLIDNIFTNNCFQAHQSGILCTYISSHLPVLCLCSMQNIVEINENKYRYIRKFNEKKIMNNFIESLESQDWFDITACHDVNIAYDCFIKSFKDVYDSCFPICKVSFKNKQNDKPWITKTTYKCK